MSNAWSLYIIILTGIMIAGVTWVLFANRTRPSSMDKTTGHKHDGIEEYDNPLPAWWFYLFVISIVFALAYLAVFPGLGKYPGALGWTSEKKWQREQQRAQDKYGAVFARYREVAVGELHTKPRAMKMAQRIFANNCAQCHGSDARGTTGFPNLVDHDWLYGGSPEQIEHSIKYGRIAAMPAWGEVLGEQVVSQLGHYLLALAATDHDEAQAKEGATAYTSYCLACHGADGTGNTALGAPKLTDDIWLYGGSLAEIKQSIRFGRNGVMPAHDGEINADKIHLLSGYVYGLSKSNNKSTRQMNSVAADSDETTGSKK